MKKLTFAFVLLLAGCPNYTGQPCSGISPCPDGYNCAQTSGDGARSCFPRCERRSDCNASAACIPFVAICDEGEREGRLDDTCTPSGSFFDLACGAGLECSSATRTCLPRCNAYSPHAEDRRCPAGYRCESSRTFPEERSTCVRDCDPALPDACGNTEQVCVRYRDESAAIFGVCENRASRENCLMTRCSYGELCIDEVCYLPTSSPPLPWNQPVIPPPVD
jgi:hypothetical protein